MMIDADPTQIFTPKDLLLSGLVDAAGKLPFFHFDVATQQQRVAAASLLGILECAFDADEVSTRSERLAPLFAKVIAAAEALNVAVVSAGIAEIKAECLVIADAWFAANPEA